MVASALLMLATAAHYVASPAAELECPVTVTGPDRVLEGIPITLAANPTNYSTYRWEVTAGEIYSGQATASIVIVNVAAGTSCTATVFVTSTDGCQSSNSHVTQVSSQNLLAEVLGPVVQDREKTRGYVQFVNSEFDPSSDVYAHSRLLYIQAQAAYDLWVQSVITAIEQDAVTSLSKNKDFKKLGASANRLAMDFISYVDDQPVKPQAKGISFASPVNIGGKIANNIGDIRKRHFEESKMMGINEVRAKAEWSDLRKRLADSFVTTAKWQRWDEIVSSPKKNP